MRNALMPAALAACALIGAPAWAADGLAGPVIYEVRSWGRIMVRWQVNPDGTGEIWRLSEYKDTAKINKFRLRLDAQRMQTFVMNVEDVREAVRGGIACKKTIFDLPYGSITWDYPGAKQVYAFDSGCQSDKGDEVQEILTAADSIVETMATIDPTPYISEPPAARSD